MKTKVLTTLLLLGLINLSSLDLPIETLAYYNDTETSSENAFGAASLDFTLSYDDWTLPATAGALEPGDSITRHMSVLADDSIPFQYKIKTVKTGGDDDFCNALDLTATLESNELYSGDLMGFDLMPPVEIGLDGIDDWTFVVTLPIGSGPFDEESCQFNFEVDGWQIGFTFGGGFSDHEALENILESAVVETEEGFNGISPIADSYVDQNDPNKNHGGDHDLKIRSQSSGKNRRAFIRFDFHFPTGTLIQSAALKLFLDNAPSVSSRTYALTRALSPWIEDDITWNNQPVISSPPTDFATTGTTNNIWLSWDVTGDIADFVSGTLSNYGWGLFDTAENSATSREGKLIARDDTNNEAERPVLEVAFSAPPAPTSHLVVNEVYYDVGSGKGSEGTNEWVELYNPTDAAVDIKNWQICDANSCDTFATTSPSILIPSHGFAVVTPNASTWTHWVLPAGAVQIVLDSLIGNGLANTGDAVILKDDSNVEIDAMNYGSDISKLNPSIPDAPEGNSLARIVKGYDANSADDWIINATPNPGTNPSDSGFEIMRFTDSGVEVADYNTGLDPLAVGNTNPEDEDTSQIDELNDFVAVVVDAILSPQDEEAPEPPAEESAPIEEITIIETETSREVITLVSEEEIIIAPEETVVIEETLPTEEPVDTTEPVTIYEETNI